MIFIVKNIEEVSVEGVDVFNFGEVLEDVDETFVDGVLAEFDLSHVETTDAGDGVAGVDDGGCLSLGLGEDDVDHVGG